jgi:thiamine pyrophosphokinase
MTPARSVLLLLGGELRDPAAVKSAARRADLVLCADGGARHAVKLKLIPDAVVGDMDSLPLRLPRAWRGVPRVVDRDEDRGDLDKSLDLARRLRAREVEVACALGGDLGHELVNLAVLERRGKEFAFSLPDAGARLLGPGRHALSLKRGARFTVLAAPHARVSLTGARYPLKNESLSRSSRGLGNRATGKTVLTVRAGLVWLAVGANARS